jgi:hypothetical protein
MAFIIPLFPTGVLLIVASIFISPILTAPEETGFRSDTAVVCTYQYDRSSC